MTNCVWFPHLQKHNNHAKIMKKIKSIIACALGVIVAMSSTVGPVYAWEYLGVQIPDYINQEEVMKQVEAGNQNIIDQLCVRFGACPVEQEEPEIENKYEDVGDTSDAFDDKKPSDDKYVPPVNQDIEDKKDAENKYDASIENPGIDYTGQLNQIMSGIMSGQSGSSGWISNGTNENVYLQWLQNYSSNGVGTYTGSTFESSAYFEYLQLARKNEATVDRYNIGSKRSIQFNLGNGYQETGIVTTDNGYISGLDAENLYEIIARAIDCEIEVSALGVSIKDENGNIATALKTSIYKTSEVISTLQKFNVDIAVRLSRTSGNFSLTEYVEGLPVEEQIVTIQFGDDKSATVNAYVKDSVVLLDAKAVAEAVGGSCSVSGSSVNISRGNSSFNGTINSTSFSLISKGSNVSGGNYKLSCPVLNIDGTTFVSTYSLIKGLGYDAFWDSGVHILYLL